MSHYKPYPAYKDSGVYAVGVIPEQWIVERIDWLFNRRREAAEPGSERVTAYIDGRVTGRSNVDQKIKAVVKDEGWQKICAGDLAISGMNAHLGGMGVSDTDGQCSPIYLVLEPSCSVNAKYVANVLRHYAAAGYISSLVNTIRYNSSDFRADDLKNIWISLPSRAEQDFIISWLDCETTRIDALVSKKSRFIELLREKRQALITHAVTKGLDPNVKMKDSGVEWLGEVPEHWAVQKTWLYFSAKKGQNAAELTKEFCSSMEGDFPVFSGQTENYGVMACIDKYEFDAGDDGFLLATTVGAKAMSTQIVRNKFSLSQNCMVIIPANAGVLINFYSYHLIPLFSYERGLIPDHMQPSFRMEDFFSYAVAVPPVSEQKEIYEYLDREVFRIDFIIAKTLISVDLLKERRSALITAAVTGQIDLREAADA